MILLAFAIETQSVLTYLVNELAAMAIARNEDLCPKFWLTVLDKVMSLLIEHGVIIGNGNELFVAESLCVCQVQVAELQNFPTTSGS